MPLHGDPQEDDGMAQSHKQRLEKQRARQREYRRKQRAARRPSRDDIARALLHFALRENLRLGRSDKLDALWDAVAAVLVEQGYDAEQTSEAFADLVDRYRRGWEFQRRFPEDGFPTTTRPTDSLRIAAIP